MWSYGKIREFLIYPCTVPFRPKECEVYVFRPDDSSETNDWVSDGHMFSCEGTRKIIGRIGARVRKTRVLNHKTQPGGF